MAEIYFPLNSSLLAALALACASFAVAHAEEADKESALKLSGFLSVVGGRVLGASLGSDYAGPASIACASCPCYTADWHNACVYEQKLSATPESRAGIQAKYAVNSDFKLITQLVVRAVDPSPSIEWAYASYAPDKHWEFQACCKRIPLYFYSDFQDIGAAYPWISAPPELYGWEASNYNGASVRYKGSVGPANVAASLFAGQETVHDSRYYKLYYPDDPTKVTWKKILGGDLEISHGPLTVRMVYIQADVRTINAGVALDDSARLKAYGVAANLDMEDWFVLSELTQLTRDFDAGYRVTAPAVTIGAGYHLGAWTPFVNYARYTERTDDAALYVPTSWTRSAVTLRYDLDARSAVKAQLDHHKDSTRNFGGTVNVVRLAYDRLF